MCMGMDMGVCMGLGTGVSIGLDIGMGMGLSMGYGYGCEPGLWEDGWRGCCCRLRLGRPPVFCTQDTCTFSWVVHTGTLQCKDSSSAVFALKSLTSTIGRSKR